MGKDSDRNKIQKEIVLYYIYDRLRLNNLPQRLTSVRTVYFLIMLKAN